MGNWCMQTWQAVLRHKWLTISIRQFHYELPLLFKNFLSEKPANEEIKCWFEMVPSEYTTLSNSSAFHVAAHQANHKVIEYLISVDFDGINRVDYINKITPLGIAIKKYHKKVTKSLLDAGANAQHGLLNFAVMTERFDIAKMLVEAGADANGLSERHYNPLHLLVFIEKCKHLEERKNMAEILIRAGADVNQIDSHGDSPLQLAIINKYFEIADVLLDAGADVTIVNEQMQTPLHLSIYKKKVELMKRLIGMKGIDLNAGDYYDKTPLCYAIEADSLEMAKLLVDAGASTNFSDVQDFYPLHEAILRNNGILIDFLMSLDAGVNLLEIKKDHQLHRGLTCLQFAALYGREEIFTKLLEYGADISAKSDDGFSVLYYATFLCHKNLLKGADYSKFIRMLISKGAGVDLTPSDELAVLSYYIATLKEDILQLFISKCGFQLSKYFVFDIYKLLSYCAEYNDVRRTLKNYIANEEFDINTKDEFGRGVVFYAVLTENVSCLKYLLKLGADVDCTDSRNGDTPLHVAIKHGNVECVKLLLFFNFNLRLQENVPLDLAVLFHICSNDREVVAQYIIKYLAIKEILDKKDVNQNQHFDSYKNLQYFYDSCREELIIMQKRIIYDSVSFFDVLVQAHRYSRNRYVVQAFADQNVLNNFCMYGNILTDQFQKARKRPLLIQHAEYGLSHILRCDSKSFAVIFDNVFKFLKNKDLRMLKFV